MRLLGTAYITLHEFHDDAIPEYAILSHTWGEEEFTLQVLQQRDRPPYRAIISRNGVREEVVIEELPDQSDKSYPINQTRAGWAGRRFKVAVNWLLVEVINRYGSILFILTREQREADRSYQLDVLLV